MASNLARRPVSECSAPFILNLKTTSDKANMMYCKCFLILWLHFTDRYSELKLFGECGTAWRRITIIVKLTFILNTVSSPQWIVLLEQFSRKLISGAAYRC